MFEQGQYIYCVYKEQSFSKAADKLFISQPSLSATIKKAEEKIGCPIFDRTQKPVSLTPFGVEYIQALARVYSIEEQLRNVISSIKALESGELSIGGSNLSIPYFLPKVISQFSKTYPNIQLSIYEMNTLEAQHFLNAGKLDLVITNQPLDERKYEQIVANEEQLLLVVPKDFEVNKKQKEKQLTVEDVQKKITQIPHEMCVPLSVFANIPFVMLRQENYLRKCTDILFEEFDVFPRIILEVAQSALAYNFASLGVGATIISNALIEKTEKNRTLCFYKIDSAHTSRKSFIYYRKNSFVTPAMNEFVNMCLHQRAPNI